MSLSKFFSVGLSAPSLGEVPNQPRSLKFPQREFGEENDRFNHNVLIVGRGFTMTRALMLHFAFYVLQHIVKKGW